MNKTVNLFSNLRFCDNIMRTAGRNNNCWLIEATRMDVYGFDMLKNSTFILFLEMASVVDPHGGQMKNWRVCSYGNFGDKNHHFHLPAKQ